VTDPLTGLRNRRYLRLHLERPPEYKPPVGGERERRLESPQQTIYLLDLDHFKQINDRHGHEAGDAVLVEVAHRLGSCLRENDCLLRWGGEEFLVIAAGHDGGGAVTLAQRILDRIGGDSIMLSGGRELHVTCSLGFAPFPWSHPGAPPDAGTLDQVLSLADVGAYLGKIEGRNRAFGIFPGPEPGLLKRLPDLGQDPTLLRREHGRSVRLHPLLGPQMEAHHQEMLLP
jgi:diguanylate cyclase (GGDEF)-like protein